MSLLNRKEFLSLLLSTLILPKSWSQTPSANPLQKQKFYILVNLWDSPARWLFDLPLRPNLTDPFKASPMISTRLNEHNQPEYTTTQVGRYHLSSFLDNPLATLDQESVSIKSLFDQACIIRGCNMNRDGHEINSKRLEAHAFGKTSLGGVIAHRYSRHFPALAYHGYVGKNRGAVGAFRTPDGRKALIASPESSQTTLRQLIEVYESVLFSKNHVKTQAAIEKISKAFQHPSTADSTQAQRIKNLHRLPFQKLYEHFESSRSKYLKIIRESLTFKIPGIDDRQMPGTTFPATFKLRPDKSQRLIDYAGVNHYEDYIITNSSVHEIFEHINLDLMAESFALAETAVFNDLSSVILLNIDPCFNVQLKNAAIVSEVTAQIKGDSITFDCPKQGRYSSPPEGLNFNHDTHFIGSHPQLIGEARHYHVLASCLHELMRSLKQHDSADLFERSLIHLTSEFDRCPQDNQSGSDHGWRGHTSTLFSGAFEGLNIIGNIKYSSGNTINDHFCTWGEAAVIKELNRELLYRDVVRTIAEFFDVPSPEGGATLLKKEHNKWIPKFTKVETIV